MQKSNIMQTQKHRTEHFVHVYQMPQICFCIIFATITIAIFVNGWISELYYVGDSCRSYSGDYCFLCIQQQKTQKAVIFATITIAIFVKRSKIFRICRVSYNFFTRRSKSRSVACNSRSKNAVEQICARLFFRIVLTTLPKSFIRVSVKKTECIMSA